MTNKEAVKQIKNLLEAEQGFKWYRVIEAVLSMLVGISILMLMLILMAFIQEVTVLDL